MLEILWGEPRPFWAICNLFRCCLCRLIFLFGMSLWFQSNSIGKFSVTNTKGDSKQPDHNNLPGNSKSLHSHLPLFTSCCNMADCGSYTRWQFYWVPRQNSSTILTAIDCVRLIYFNDQKRKRENQSTFMTGQFVLIRTSLMWHLFRRHFQLKVTY